MLSSLSQVLVHSLTKNNFSRTQVLGEVLLACQPTDQEVRRLLADDYPEQAIVFRSKHNKEYRPGSHLSPRSVLEWSSLFSELEEYYWLHARRFDNSEVFSPILYSEDESDRAVQGKLFDSTSYSRFLLAIRNNALRFGGHVGRMDVRLFYSSITPEHVLDLLGRGGLELPSTLVDLVSLKIEEYRGNPQGYPTSDLLARLLLTVLDRRLYDYGIHFIRQTDDILVFGKSPEDINHQLRVISQELIRIRFEPNGDKRNIESPSRLRWCSQGVFWGEVPIEYYEDEVTENEDVEVIVCGDGSAGFGFSSKHHGVDYRRLYIDEFAPQKPCRSDHGNRLTLRQVGAQEPEIIIRDAKELVLGRACNVPLILSGLKESRSRSRVAWIAYKNIRGHESREDDRLLAIERSNSIVATDLAERFSRASIKTRAVRHSLYSLLASNDCNIEVAAKLLPPYAWLDEHAAYCAFLTRHESSASRIARSLGLSYRPELGTLYDMVEQFSKTKEPFPR